MSASLEDLVRAAQQEQANRAVHPQRILAALPRRQARLVRRRRLAVAVAVAAVVAVLAIPALTLTNRGAGPAPPPAVTPTVSVSPSPAPVVAAMPLRYKPTWLPAGYAEYGRNVLESTLSRYWSRHTSDLQRLSDAPILYLNVTPEASGVEPPDGAEERVDINGAEGVYRPADRLVSWRIGRVGLSVGAIRLNLSKGTLLRVARSVRADTTVLDWPFRLSAPPDGMSAFARSLSGTGPDDWAANLDFTSGTGSASARISVGTRTPAPKGGSGLTVAGRSARYVKSPRAGYYLVVDLGAGRLLTVSAVGRDRAAMIAMAEHVSLVDAPDLTWMGRS